LVGEPNQAGESIEVLSDRLRWLLTDAGECVDAHLDGVGMAEVTDEEVLGRFPVQPHCIFLPKLEVNKLGELVEEDEIPGCHRMPCAAHRDFEPDEEFISVLIRGGFAASEGRNDWLGSRG
jgi:hypothetical protein